MINSFIALGLHILIGLFSYFSPQLLSIYILFILGYCLFDVIRSANSNGKAHKYAAYFVGCEVLLRMVEAVTFWEFGKYSVILILVVGLVVDKSRASSSKLVYLGFLALVPGIILAPYDSFDIWRKAISSNLSGISCLLISILYFYKRKVSSYELMNTFKFLLLPVLSMLVVIFLRMPSLANIEFTLSSNFSTSGGFGPNQVSTIIGFGFCILVTSKFIEKDIFNRYIDVIFIALLLGFGLLTFSRGGIMTAVISIIIGFTYKMLFIEKKIKFFLQSIFIATTFLFVWSYISDNTSNILDRRYLSVIDDSGNLNFSNRLTILSTDISIFYDNYFLGAGVGGSSLLRPMYGFISSAAHTEFSRLLADHGLFGLLVNLLIFVFSISRFLSLPKSDEKLLFFIFTAFSLLTFSHSAIRIAAPTFAFGISLIDRNE